MPPRTERATRPAFSTGAPETLIRLAVPMLAVAGALALWWAGMLAGEDRLAEWIPAATALAIVGGLLWLWRPGIGGWLLGILGGVAIGFSGLAASVNGVVPWQLIALWAGVTLLIAALIEGFSRGAENAAGVTVLAVVTLLALSAIGIAGYVQLNWTASERGGVQGLREDTGLSGPAGSTSELSVSPAPGGAWRGVFQAVTDDPQAAWDAMRARLESRGWAVVEQVPGRSLRALRGGVQCDVAATKAEEYAGRGPASYSAQSRWVQTYTIRVTAHEAR